MGPIIAIAVKDLKLVVRDRTAAFFIFIFPIFVAMFFGFIFGNASRGGSGQIPILVVSESTGPRTAAFVADLKQDKALAVTEIATRSEAEALVRRGKVVACVVVPASFDGAALNLFGGGGLTLHLITDPSRFAEAGLLEGKLNELAFRQLAKMMQDPAALRESTALGRAALLLAPMSDEERAALGTVFGGLDTFSAAMAKSNTVDGTEPAADGGFEWRPLRVEVSTVLDERKRPTNSFEISFGQGVVWGLMSCVTGFGASLAEERTRGTLLRLRTAPIRRRQVLLGKALAAFVACLLVQALLLGLAVTIFGVVITSPFVAVVATVITSIGFSGLMMMLAGLTKTEGGAQGLGRAAVLVLAMIGGGTIPLFLMPSWLQTISLISPFSWATAAVDGYIWRAFTLTEMALPLTVLAAVGIIGFVIGTISMRWQEA